MASKDGGSCFAAMAYLIVEQRPGRGAIEESRQQMRACDLVNSQRSTSIKHQMGYGNEVRVHSSRRGRAVNGPSQSPADATRTPGS